jgi:hypothetical protein
MSQDPDDETDINFLMSMLATDYTDNDIDKIIAIQRKSRALKEAGVKPARTARPKATMAEAQDLIEKLGLRVKKTPSNFIRRD